MTIDTSAVVRRSTVVPVPQQEAFDRFTLGFGDFKPREHNLFDSSPIVATRFEPRVGGHIVDTTADGRECAWARVLVFERPDRVVFSWDITPEWELSEDPDQASEVEVRFTPEGAGTRVEIEHRDLEKHGVDWQRMRDGVDSPDGWDLYLERYAATIG